MKSITLSYFLFFSVFVSFAQTSLIFLTYNIRFNNPADGSNAWPNRKEIMIDTLKNLNGSIYCFQEALNGQFNDLIKGLSDYEAYGIGRDNGKTKGEFAPIFYKKSDWECLEKSTFWLSESSHKPSKGWDADLPRIVSWVKLKSISNGKVLFVFNTHFDHKGVEARKESGKLLAAKSKEIAKELPYIVCGDFNLTSDHPSYQLMVKELKDSRKEATEKIGTEHSFAGFEVNNPPNPMNRIDYIFVHPSIKVEHYNCLDWKRNSEHWLSDHRPVYIRISAIL